MEQVEGAVGQVTSFLRRWVMGALDHQHAPLPQDEDSDGRPYSFHAGPAGQQPGQSGQSGQPGWWMSWMATQPNPGHGNYAPTLQSESDSEMTRDEQFQMEEAMRRSRRERESGGDRDRDRYDDYEGARDRDYDDRPRARGRGRGEEEMTEEEREQRDLQRAMELSKKEAEEAERARKAAEAAAPPPDLMSMEADLLGLGGAGIPSTSSPAGSQLIPFDPTTNDEAIARTLNLLDNDFGPSDSELMSKIEANRPNKPRPEGEVDLMQLVDAPSSGLTGQSGALVPINPNKPLFRPPPSQGSCGGCGKKIEAGRFLNCLNKTWHPQCFKCQGCSLPISDREFKLHEGAPFHDACYKTRFHPKCSVCEDYIAPGGNGLIQFRTLPFWDHKTCLAHSEDGTAQCTSCQRFEPRGSPFVDLKDGRKLCLECVGEMVVDSDDCMPLYLAVQEFFGQLGMPIRQEIPLLCVETQALNEAAQGEKGHHGHSGHSVTRGLCLSEEHTVRAVVRLPGGAHGGLPFAGLGQREQILTRHCEVTAILVLYGLPRLLTGEILAHELMHAWFRLDGGFPPLSPDLEEGLCQVLAHLWLQAQVGALAASQGAKGPSEAFQSKFLEFCMHQIAMDTSPVYGDGFRNAYTATVQHGLVQTLNHVRKTGQLPK